MLTSIILVKNNEVHELYFWYVLSPFLFIAHDVDDKDVDNVYCLPNNEHMLSSLSCVFYSIVLDAVRASFQMH